MDFKRAVCIEPGNIQLETQRLDDTPAEDEVLIKVKWLGLCGSDLHIYEGSYGGPHHYPVTPGHEWSGEIVTCGAQVEHFKPRDRVTSDASLWCGECKYCLQKEGNRNICINLRKRGLTADGAASEFIFTKAKYLYKVPDNLEYEIACMAELFAVSLQAIHNGMGKDPALYADKKVLVIGIGPVGMSILMLLLKAYGFKNVYASDLNSYRMDIAKRLGGFIYPILTSTDEDMSYTGLYDIDGFDFVFETTGVSKVFDNATRLINPLGKIISLAPISNLDLTKGLLVLKSITVSGSIGGTGSFEEALKFLTDNPEYYRNLISHRFAFSEIKAALESQAEETELMKVVIHIQD